MSSLIPDDCPKCHAPIEMVVTVYGTEEVESPKCSPGCPAPWRSAWFDAHHNPHVALIGPGGDYRTAAAWEADL